MPDPAAKTETVPATAAADPAETKPVATAGQAAAPAPDATALQAELQAERQKRIESERSYANLRALDSRKDQELNTLRTLRDSVLGAGQVEDTSGNGDVELANEVLATREEVAWMRFQQAHPKYSDFWDEMKEIAGDPVYKRTIESFRVVRGQPVLDTFATLHNAYNEVELRRIRKSQSETATRAADADANNRKIKSQAVISGSGAASEEGGLENLSLEQLMAMDYNEIIKHVPIDPRDPPRGI